MSSREIQIVQISEHEYFLGENRIFIDEDHILHFINIGKVDEETAKATCKICLQLKNLSSATVHFLIDLNQGRETTLKARRILKEFTEKHIQGRMAFCGLHPVAKVLAGFFLKMTNKKDMRFFKTRNEAIQWLRSG